jgi:hypothetical protein
MPQNFSHGGTLFAWDKASGQASTAPKGRTFRPFRKLIAGRFAESFERGRMGEVFEIQ